MPSTPIKSILSNPGPNYHGNPWEVSARVVNLTQIPMVVPEVVKGPKSKTKGKAKAKSKSKSITGILGNQNLRDSVSTVAKTILALPLQPVRNISSTSSSYSNSCRDKLSSAKQSITEQTDIIMNDKLSNTKNSVMKMSMKTATSSASKTSCTKITLTPGPRAKQSAKNNNKINSDFGHHIVNNQNHMLPTPSPISHQRFEKSRYKYLKSIHKLQQQKQAEDRILNRVRNRKRFAWEDEEEYNQAVQEELQDAKREIEMRREEQEKKMTNRNSIGKKRSQYQKNESDSDDNNDINLSEPDSEDDQSIKLLSDDFSHFTSHYFNGVIDPYGYDSTWGYATIQCIEVYAKFGCQPLLKKKYFPYIVEGGIDDVELRRYYGGQIDNVAGYGGYYKKFKRKKKSVVQKQKRKGLPVRSKSYDEDSDASEIIVYEYQELSRISESQRKNLSQSKGLNNGVNAENINNNSSMKKTRTSITVQNGLGNNVNDNTNKIQNNIMIGYKLPANRINPGLPLRFKISFEYDNDLGKIVVVAKDVQIRGFDYDYDKEENDLNQKFMSDSNSTTASSGNDNQKDSNENIDIESNIDLQQELIVPAVSAVPKTKAKAQPKQRLKNISQPKTKSIQNKNKNSSKSKSNLDIKNDQTTKDNIDGENDTLSSLSKKHPIQVDVNFYSSIQFGPRQGYIDPIIEVFDRSEESSLNTQDLEEFSENTLRIMGYKIGDVNEEEGDEGEEGDQGEDGNEEEEDEDDSDSDSRNLNSENEDDDEEEEENSDSDESESESEAEEGSDNNDESEDTDDENDDENESDSPSELRPCCLDIEENDDDEDKDGKKQYGQESQSDEYTQFNNMVEQKIRDDYGIDCLDDLDENDREEVYSEVSLMLMSGRYRETIDCDDVPTVMKKSVAIKPRPMKMSTAVMRKAPVVMKKSVVTANSKSRSSSVLGNTVTSSATKSKTTVSKAGMKKTVTSATPKICTNMKKKSSSNSVSITKTKNGKTNTTGTKSLSTVQKKTSASTVMSKKMVRKMVTTVKKKMNTNKMNKKKKQR